MTRRRVGDAADPHELLLSQCRPLDSRQADHRVRDGQSDAKYAPGHVVEETCGALIGFENGAFASATASYIGPEGMPDPQPRFVCAEGGILPNADSPPGKDSITVFHRGRSEVRAFANEPSPLVRQAAAFLDAIEGRREARNPPEDALLDVEIAAAVSVSAREHRRSRWPKCGRSEYNAQPAPWSDCGYC